MNEKNPLSDYARVDDALLKISGKDSTTGALIYDSWRTISKPLKSNRIFDSGNWPEKNQTVWFHQKGRADFICKQVGEKHKGWHLGWNSGTRWHCYFCGPMDDIEMDFWRALNIPDFCDFKTTLKEPKETFVPHPEINSQLLYAAQLAYRKHNLNDDSVSWTEVTDRLWDAICESMGNDAAIAWADSFGAEDD